MSTDEFQAAVIKELRSLRRDMAQLQRKEQAKNEEWITGRKMKELTGMNDEQLRYWRGKNPALWHNPQDAKVDKLDRTVRRGITYNWTAYLSTLRPAIN